MTVIGCKLSVAQWLSKWAWMVIYPIGNGINQARVLGRSDWRYRNLLGLRVWEKELEWRWEKV
jgi:hypothetical protein